MLRQTQFFPWFGWKLGIEWTVLISIAWVVAILPLETAALSITTFVAFLLLVWQPWLIWPAVATILPFASDIDFGQFRGIDILLILAVGIWLLNGAFRRTLQLRNSALASLTIAYLAVLLVTLPVAFDIGEAVKEVVKWTEFLVVLFIVRDMIGREQIWWLVSALLMGGALQALLGIVQFIYQIGPTWFIIFDRFMRAHGSFHQPNPFAGYLGLTLPVAVSLALWTWGWFCQSKQRSALQTRLLWGTALLAVSLLIGSGLLASWSRGGWLGALGGSGIVLLFWSRRFRLFSYILSIPSVLVIYLLNLNASILPASIQQRIEAVTSIFNLNQGGFSAMLTQPITSENFATLERLAHWQAALQMWESSPWFGIGPGNYAAIYPAIIQSNPILLQWEEPLGHAHNIYLNVLAETGLVGFGIFLIFWIGISIYLCRCYLKLLAAETVFISGTLSHNRASGQSALVLGILGTTVHLLIHSFFDNLFVQGIYLHIAMWLAIVTILNDAIKTPIHRDVYVQ
ncbi:O-antigen ligase family protein [Chloroflexi bacterium TSY]|nr:O-antigen ligase family protein [Chloroflexi bacterium TSY]